MWWLDWGESSGWGRGWIYHYPLHTINPAKALAAPEAQVLQEEPVDAVAAHDAMAHRKKGKAKRSGQIIYVS
jgi:hypothetical protein